MRSKYPKISAISSVALVLEVRHSWVPRTGQSSPTAEAEAKAVILQATRFPGYLGTRRVSRSPTAAQSFLGKVLCQLHQQMSIIIIQSRNNTLQK